MGVGVGEKLGEKWQAQRAVREAKAGVHRAPRRYGAGERGGRALLG